MPSLLDRVADFMDPLVERAQKYLVRDPETGKMVTPEELEFQTAVRAEMRRQQAEKERLQASRLGPAGRTFEQTTGQEYLNEAEMDWYREQARQREAAAQGRDIFRGVSGMAKGIAQTGGGIADLSSQVAPLVESAREADRVALEEGRPASQERLLELQLRNEAGQLQTGSPEWQELAGLVRQERREGQQAAQGRQFDAFVQAIQEKQPDLDLAGATRIARARLEASGGDLSKALGTFEEAYRNLYERSDPFLTAALPIAAGAPLVGGGIAANLLGRGSLGLGRYLASGALGEAGGYAGAQAAKEIGAPPIAGALLGGLTGGVAGAIAPTPGQVGRTAARRISEAAPGIAAAADVPNIGPRLTAPEPVAAGRPRKVPAPAASVAPELAPPSPSAARGRLQAEVAAGQAQPPAGAGKADIPWKSSHEPIYKGSLAEGRNNADYAVEGYKVSVDNVHGNRNQLFVSVEREGIQGTEIDPLALDAFTSRSPGGSVSGLRRVGQFLDDLATENPGRQIFADPTDARRSAAYVRLGFSERPDGLLILDKAKLTESLGRGAGAVPPAGTGGTAPPSVPPGPGQLPERGKSGIERAIKAKETTTLTPGRAFGQEGSIQRKIVGAVNPSVDIPAKVHVNNQARAAVQAAEGTAFQNSYMPAAAGVENAMRAAPPRYIGPADNPFKGLAGDYLQNPRFYADVSPDLKAAKQAWEQAGLANISRARAEYDVDIDYFKPKDPEGVYVSNFKAKDGKDLAIPRTAESLTSKTGIAKERAYDSWYDHWKADDTFTPVTDLREVADLHSRSLAYMASNNTFKEGMGKTRLEVLAETNPALAKSIGSLKDRLDSLKGSLGRLDDRIKAAVDEFQAGPQNAEAIEKLRNDIDVRIQPGSTVNAGKAPAKLRAQIKGTKDLLAELRQYARQADTGDYIFSPDTYRWHPSSEAAAIHSVLKKGFDNAFIEGAIDIADVFRAGALGPDFSPLTIQGSLGAFSHPEVTIKNGTGLFKAFFQNAEELAGAVDPDLVKRFEFASGRRIGSLGPEFAIGERGFRLPGQPVKKFNDALMRVVDYGTLKAFQNDSALLMRLGETSREVADAEAANSIGKFIPRLDLTGTARSAQRARLERFPLTSPSYVAQPFSLAKDFASGAAKLASGRGGQLLGREKLALLRGSTFAGSITSISVASALASADANNKSPIDAVKEVLNPASPRFMSLILGNAGSVGLGGPMRRAILGIYRMVDTGPKGVVKYGRGSLSPPIGGQLDVLINRDWRGRPIREGSPWNQVADWLKYTAKNANLVSGGVVEGYEDEGLRGAAIQGVASGLGQNFFERTAYDKTDETIRGEVGKTLPGFFRDKDGSLKPVKTYQDLKAASPLAAEEFDKRHPELAEARLKQQRETSQESARMQKELLDRQSKRDDLLRTNPAEWRRASSEDSRETGIRIDQLWTDAGDYNKEDKTLLDVAQRKYHDAIEAATDENTNEVDWDAVDRTVATMSKEEKDLLFETRLKGETEPRKQYIRDLEVLVPYFEQRDQAWQELAASDPQLAGYKTFDDFRQAMIAEVHDAGLGWTEAAVRVDAKLDRYSEAVGRYANIYLAENADAILPLLDKYDFYVPAKFKKYVRKAA